MDFIALQTDQGAEFLFNMENITLIDAKNCQLYTVDNPAYGWTLSQKSMDDLMHAIGPHIVAADQPEPVAKVWKEWNPNDKQDPPPTVTVVPLEPIDWGDTTDTLEHLIELNYKKGKLLKKALEAAFEMEANEARKGINL